ncbi:MAG: replication protein RepA [Candidatus Aenigmarchaeota archaeon]|nr:replication protein RepA [Candidatus Aenigmarchaeota archaeon]
MSSPQRIAARERRISDIKPDDTRVCIVGTVVSSEPGLIAVDDGTGKINVTFDDAPSSASGQLVRVFGRTVPMESGFEIQGEAVQDFSGADIELWKKVSGLWESSIQQL